MSVVNAGLPDAECLYYSLDVDGVPKGLIVASSYKIKQTIIKITITRTSTNITFIGQFQLSFELKKEKNKPYLFYSNELLSPKIYKCIKFGSMAEFHHKF